MQATSSAAPKVEYAFKPGTRNKKHTSAVGLCGVTWGQARSALQHCNVYTPALYSEVPASNLGVVTGTLSNILSTAGLIPADRLLYTPLRCHYLPSPYNWRPGSTCPWQSDVTLRRNARYFNTPNGRVTAGLTLRNLSTTSEPTQRSRFYCSAVERNRFRNFKGINS
jgi:hypothetical protein